MPLLQSIAIFALLIKNKIHRSRNIADRCPCSDGKNQLHRKQNVRVFYRCVSLRRRDALKVSIKFIVANCPVYSRLDVLKNYINEKINFFYNFWIIPSIELLFLAHGLIEFEIFNTRGRMKRSFPRICKSTPPIRSSDEATKHKEKCLGFSATIVYGCLQDHKNCASRDGY